MPPAPKPVMSAAEIKKLWERACAAHGMENWREPFAHLVSAAVLRKLARRGFSVGGYDVIEVGPLKEMARASARAARERA